MSGPNEKKDAEPLAVNVALNLLEQRLKSSQGELAARTDVGPEVLDYLARHGAVATRAAVAANPSASAESNYYLTDDAADEVRHSLAQKIGRLFPGMLLVEKEHLRDLTIKTLERLAADEAVRVRAILAEEIKELDCIPHAVAKVLAADMEAEVASPILEFSPLLTDADLIEVVAAAETNDILGAVARRKGLNEPVSDAVVATRNTGAIAELLKNVDASIRKRTLDRIVSQAAEVAEWRGPLVLRAELSQNAVRRLAGFVGSALIRTLAERHRLDAKTLSFLEKKLEERQRQELSLFGDDFGGAAGEENAAADVDAAFRSGVLNDGFVARAVASHHRETVVCALSRLTTVDENIVRTLLDSKSAKVVTALVWLAGLNMRSAYKIQTTVMHLKGKDLLPARGGTDFPMTEEEMRWQLSCAGIIKD